MRYGVPGGKERISQAERVTDRQRKKRCQILEGRKGDSEPSSLQTFYFAWCTSTFWPEKVDEQYRQVVWATSSQHESLTPPDLEATPTRTVSQGVQAKKILCNQDELSNLSRESGHKLHYTATVHTHYLLYSFSNCETAWHLIKQILDTTMQSCETILDEVWRFYLFCVCMMCVGVLTCDGTSVQVRGQPAGVSSSLPLSGRKGLYLPSHLTSPKF